jgi:ABC-type uncharacterized transport system substrate-binding protein
MASDDGSVTKTVNSELQLATGLSGVDPAIMKQDFLTQAENLVRTIAESQLPALYQGVSDAHAAKKAEEADRDSKGVAALRDKLLTMRKAKQDAEAANAVNGAADIIKCVDGGTRPETEEDSESGEAEE